jgi:hypothetical protein
MASRHSQKKIHPLNSRASRVGSHEMKLLDVE